jgi:uncharacterized radical SAM superfamily Fe-S cluster-containing enzyme
MPIQTAAKGKPAMTGRIDGMRPPAGRFSREGGKPLMAMVEVTNRCNMACPVCYADAGPDAADVPIDEIRARLQRLLAVTGTPIPIQISGGEPTLREDLPDIVALAKRLGYRHIELITNGIRIAREPAWLNALRDRGLTAVYLQFDGLGRETLLRIRGRDMRSVRRNAIAAVRRADLCCTLAVVVTRGVNDQEIGDIVRFAVDHIDVVRAINFQSATRMAGRFGVSGTNQGFALRELVDRIAEQTGVGADTFLSEHMGHPACNAMSLVFVVDGRIEPLFKYIRHDDLMRFLGADRREKVLAAFAGKADFFSRYLCHPAAWKLIAKAAPIFGNNPTNVLQSRSLLLFAKSFMEREALDPQRMAQCCYAITGPTGVFSFCAYNNCHRFAETQTPTIGGGRRTAP